MLTVRSYAYFTNIAVINIQHTDNGHRHKHELLQDMCLKTFIVKRKHKCTEYDKMRSTRMNSKMRNVTVFFGLLAHS